MKRARQRDLVAAREGDGSRRLCSGYLTRDVPAATFREPRWVGDDGGRTPTATTSAATMPKASGKIDGTTETSDSGSRWHEVPVLERAREERAGRRVQLPACRGSRRSTTTTARASTAVQRLDRAPARPCSRSACRSRPGWARRRAKNWASTQHSGVRDGAPHHSTGSRRGLRRSARRARSRAARARTTRRCRPRAAPSSTSSTCPTDVLEHTSKTYSEPHVIHRPHGERHDSRPSATRRSPRCRASSTQTASRAPSPRKSTLHHGADRRTQRHVIREHEIGRQRARAAPPRSPRRTRRAAPRVKSTSSRASSPS